MKRYLGVDLHRNGFTVHTRQEDGSGTSRTWTLQQLPAFARTVEPTDAVAVEATGNIRLFQAALQGRQATLVVVNPHQFEVISRSVKKTDEQDAKVLAEFLAKGLLPEVRMKDERAARIASLAQTRDKLVKLRTVLKNKVNNLLAARGILLRKESLASEKGLTAVLAAPVPDLDHLELEILVGEIRHLNASIQKLEGLLRDQGPSLPGWTNLTSITGIGTVGASILLSTIGNIADFPSEGKLAAYFGIVPRVHNSNATERSGHITKRGAKLGRTALVQCALIAARYSPYLQAYYRRLAATRGTGKAIIALARKFLGVIYKTLKHNWIFADFPRFVLANG